MGKRLAFILVAAIVLVVAALLVMPGWYRLHSRFDTDAALTGQLRQLGDSALQTGDVPVAAVLLFEGKVTGTGYNTVTRNRRAGEHAEINAITSAMQQLGPEGWGKLDKNKLTMLTTLEPCAMCRGALLEYGILHTAVVQPKSLRHWWRRWRRSVSYEWQKQQASNDSLQEQLFRAHPQYDPAKAKADL
jgi:tRNA(Arg) A34 adenosine deaminase TadA